MTKMDEASNPCGGDIEAEMCQLMREQPPAEGVVDRVALQRHRNVALITLSHPQAQNALNLASWRRLKRLLDDLAGESGCGRWCCGAPVTRRSPRVPTSRSFRTPA